MRGNLRTIRFGFTNFMISIFILAAVFVLTAVRQIGNLKLQIWHIMLGGAAAVLATGQISVLNALGAINTDVILFLLGMFIVGEALDRSGFLSAMTYNIFKKAGTVDALFVFIIFGMGLISVFLMNDTVAIIGTPLVLLLASKNKIPPKYLLLALAFSVTTGSVMSPIGNPQNLLIAVSAKFGNPFIVFSRYLFIPTFINLAVLFYMFRFFYKEKFNPEFINNLPEQIKDEKLAGLSKLSLSIIILLVFFKVTLIFFDAKIDFKLTYIALAAALPVVLFSRRRIEIVKKIDWSTIIFFAAMFVLMQSVWNSGYFQELIKDSKVDITSLFMILTAGVVLSQFISNVPLVALYLPVLMHAGISSKGLTALAAGSTIAGNLFILGAASNIIIIQNAEKRAGETITFWEFAKFGIPLTIINVLVYYVCLSIF